MFRYLLREENIMTQYYFYTVDREKNNVYWRNYMLWFELQYWQFQFDLLYY